MATYHAVMVEGGTDEYPESQLIFKGVVVEMPRGKGTSVGPTEASFGIVATVYSSPSIAKNNPHAVLLRLDNKGVVMEPAQWDVLRLEQRTCLYGRVMRLNVSDERHGMAVAVLGEDTLAQIVAEKHTGDIKRAAPATVGDKRTRKQATWFMDETTPTTREKTPKVSRKGKGISPDTKGAPVSVSGDNAFANFRRVEAPEREEETKAMDFTDRAKYWGAEWRKLSPTEKAEYKNVPLTATKPSRRATRTAAKQQLTLAVHDAVGSAVGSAMDTAVSTAVSSAVSSAFAAQSATHAQHAQHAAPMDYGAAQATIVQHKQTELRAAFEVEKSKLFN
jgi:hypothetical protein